MTGVTQALGWSLLLSLAQGGIVTAVVGLALWIVPQDRAGLRHTIALAGLLVVTAAFLTTAGFLLVDWRAHVSCWESVEVRGARLPSDCLTHGVREEAVRVASSEGGKAEAVLAWVPAAHVPEAPRLRELALATTGTAGVLGGLWLAALLLLTVQEARTYRSLRRVLSGSRPVLDPGALAALRDLAAALGIRSPIPLWETPDIGTPCVAGIARPVILMPEGLLAALEPLELRGVLAHELEHVRRRDPLVIALQRSARLLLFFNPFASWISRWIREECEAACDRAGADGGARSRPGYAGMLLVLEGFRSMPGASRTALPLLAEKGLKDRIRRLLASSPSRRSVRAGALIAMVLAALAGGLFARASLSGSALGSWAIMVQDIERRAVPRD